MLVNRQSLQNHLQETKSLRSRLELDAVYKKMSFSTASHIILETRTAIIQHVEEKIAAVDNAENIIFLIGGTGSGKSTTLCFLRGDEMFLKYSDYQSKSDKHNIIGHALASSCTFLPNIAVVDKMILIDFSGFDDTNGILVELGMECALKALIMKYHPKFLVIESITNTEGRYSEVASHGLRLSRLIVNKEQACVLGLTKYTQDVDYIRLQKAEENSKEYENYKNILNNREATFLKEIGIPLLIRFDSLEKKETLNLCLDALKQGTLLPSQVNPKYLLAAKTESLLADLFSENYIKNNKENYSSLVILNDFESLKKAYEQTSLIHAVFPIEIGTFFHLPEIDPTLVHKFDKKIIDACVEKYIGSIFALNLPAIKIFVDHLEKTDVVIELEKQITALDQYLKRIHGIKEEDENKWWTYQRSDKLQKYDIHYLFKLPAWTCTLSYIQPILPESLFIFSKNIIKKQYHFFSDDVLINCAYEVTNLFNTLRQLKQIENMIKYCDLDKLLYQNKSIDLIKLDKKFFSMFNKQNKFAKNIDPLYQKWANSWDKIDSSYPEEKIITFLKEYIKDHQFSKLYIWKDPFDHVLDILQDKNINQKSAVQLLTSLEKIKLKKSTDPLMTIIQVIKDKITMKLDHSYEMMVLNL